MSQTKPYRVSHLDALEAESIFVMREVMAEFERPVLLFSGGKDSIVMLRLAEKAFTPAKIPFPVMHVDTGHNFPEVLDYRDTRVATLGLHLVVASVQEAIDTGLVRELPHGTRNRIQPPVLRAGPRRGCCWPPSRNAGSAPCSAAPGGTRRRPAPRSACSASATSSASGTRKTSGPSCGGSTTAGTTRASRSGCSR